MWHIRGFNETHKNQAMSFLTKMCGEIWQLKTKALNITDRYYDEPVDNKAT